jgi:hypothetical protein
MTMYNDENTYGIESTRTVQGIMFCLPSCQRFIPYSWLAHSEMNGNQTEIQFHYTHTVVTVTGARLGTVHEAVIRSYLYALRESKPTSLTMRDETTVSRIEIAEKVES